MQPLARGPATGERHSLQRGLRGAAAPLPLPRCCPATLLRCHFAMPPATPPAPPPAPPATPLLRRPPLRRYCEAEPGGGQHRQAGGEPLAKELRQAQRGAGARGPYLRWDPQAPRVMDAVPAVPAVRAVHSACKAHAQGNAIRMQCAVQCSPECIAECIPQWWVVRRIASRTEPMTRAKSELAIAIFAGRSRWLSRLESCEEASPVT